MFSENTDLCFLYWNIQRELFTPEEIAASNPRVALIGELVKARQEKGSTSPQIDTILKMLAPLGKTLAIVPLQKQI